MRLAGRYISREEIFGATDSYEIIEPYPEDSVCSMTHALLDSAG